MLKPELEETGHSGKCRAKADTIRCRARTPEAWVESDLRLHMRRNFNSHVETHVHAHYTLRYDMMRYQAPEWTTYYWQEPRALAGASGQARHSL